MAGLIGAGRYDEAAAARGQSFTDLLGVFDTLSMPPRTDVPPSGRRVAIMHGGALAPGMNTATRALVRFGVAQGHTMLGVNGSFPGLAAGHLSELSWGDVEELVGEGGSSLGTRRESLDDDGLYAMSRSLEQAEVHALVVVGGIDAYLTVHQLVTERSHYPALRMPIVLLPASIDNNLPGTELAVGADTALNSAVWALDRIKQSGSASRRCFVAETMGRSCGYLTLMTGLAAGAEQVYLPEHGITLATLQEDVGRMRAAFERGRRLFLAIRNEQAGGLYTTDFMVRLFEEEGHELFDVRPAVLGHLQQGGNPSPFDRIFATRLAHHAIDGLSDLLARGEDDATYVGLFDGSLRCWPVGGMLEQLDVPARRPHDQWWLDLLPALRAMADTPG